MKLLTLVAAFLAVLPATLAFDQKKSAVVYFDDERTPQAVIKKAMDAITKSGGHITHVYEIINGFAALASQRAFAALQAMDLEYPMRVEDDDVVSAN